MMDGLLLWAALIIYTIWRGRILAITAFKLYLEVTVYIIALSVAAVGFGPTFATAMQVWTTLVRTGMAVLGAVYNNINQTAM
jgi:hypothetical protein